MRSVIGVGELGSRMVGKFGRYEGYELYRIVSVSIDGIGEELVIGGELGHEGYEENFIGIPWDISGDVLVIVDGSEAISGILLRLMEGLSGSGCSLEVIYGRPDTEFLSDIRERQERIVFGIIQEYARSGVLDRVYLVQNSSIEEVVGDVSVVNYYDMMDDAVVSTYNMVDSFRCGDGCVMGTMAERGETMRISTMGVVREGEERLFYPMDGIGEREYYYGVPELEIGERGDILREVRSYCRKMSEGGSVRVSYGIYSTGHKEMYTFCVINSSKIQKNA